MKIDEKKYSKISHACRKGVQYGLYESNLWGDLAPCKVVKLDSKEVLFETYDCLLDALKTYYGD